MLIDTDVLIWYLRGNENAHSVIRKNIPFKISVINYMELVQGMRNKKELKLLKEYLKNWSIKVIQISENISTKAMFFVEDYYLSHSMELADALMAATAIDSNEVLLTGNGKQYDFIPNLEIIRFRQ